MKMDPFDFPRRLAACFGKRVDSIEIMVTLRNQASFIYSNYVQSYRYFIHDPNVSTFDRYLSHCLANKDCFSSYYYHALLAEYAAVFTKGKLHILLYEDFLSAPSEFMQALSEILNIEKSFIQEKLADKHWNQKGKTEQGETIVSNVNRPFVEKIMRKIRLNRFIMRTYYKFEDIYGMDNVFNRLMRLIQKRDRIPAMTGEHKKIIFHEFQEGNQKLAAEFGIDEAKLKKHGYV